MKPTAQDPRCRPVGESKLGAYSLVELLVVVAVVGLLLAFAAPGLVALGPSRKAGLHQIAGFLDRARAEAIATGEERIVAFADERFPMAGEALRAYALFAPDPATKGAAGGGPSPLRSLRRLSPWRTLPKGLVFARGESFEAADGAAFRTLHDLARTQAVPLPDPDGGADGGALPQPCLVFGPDGGVRRPDRSDADALHLGLVEGYFDPATKRPVTTSRGSGDCLGIGYYTGRVRLLTD